LQLIHDERKSREVDEPDTQSFIVKVWLEETAEESGRAKWRGHITHVRSGNRQYLDNLSGIAIFIRPYLERWGVKFGVFHRLRVFVVDKTSPCKKPKKSA
jgi:hypothetical protein